MALPQRFTANAPTPRLQEIISSEDRVEEISDTDDEYEDMGTATLEEQANIAYLESVRIPIRDAYVTDTSEAQDETYKVILPYLEGNPNDFSLNTKGIPKLQRERHVPMLKKMLGDYPSQFAMMDASRPWIMYWCLQGLTALGVDISEYQTRQVIHSETVQQ